MDDNIVPGSVQYDSQRETFNKSMSYQTVQKKGMKRELSFGKN